MDSHHIFLMGEKGALFFAMSLPRPKAVMVLVNGCHPSTPLKGWADAHTAKENSVAPRGSGIGVSRPARNSEPLSTAAGGLTPIPLKDARAIELAQIPERSFFSMFWMVSD
ncbi:MAG: hypothetical protein ACKPEY_18620 [Planctomycetota bacterium]